MNNSVITDSQIIKSSGLSDCPYNAQNCPKVEQVKDDVNKITEKLDYITRLIYVLIGVILCEFGTLII